MRLDTWEGGGGICDSWRELGLDREPGSVLWKGLVARKSWGQKRLQFLPGDNQRGHLPPLRGSQ